jgi:hypothetical protein
MKASGLGDGTLRHCSFDEVLALAARYDAERPV